MSNSLANDRLAAIRQAHAQAEKLLGKGWAGVISYTPAVGWQVCWHPDGPNSTPYTARVVCIVPPGWLEGDKLAAYIAEAIQHVPALLDEVERLRKRLAELEQAMKAAIAVRTGEFLAALGRHDGGEDASNG